MKKMILCCIAVFTLFSCENHGKVRNEDPADKYVGDYDLDLVEDVTWGYDSGIVTSSGHLKIIKTSSTKISTSGFFSTTGRISGGKLYLESLYLSDNSGYTNTVFDPAVIEDGIIHLSATSSGVLNSYHYHSLQTMTLFLVE